jgi:uncharacterized protein (TIGR00730 family)
MKKLCVFCGSAPGHSPQYVEQARKVGKIIAQNQWGLVYGGGKVGLMGAVTDAALEHGSKVVGIIPGHLVSDEVAHRGVTELHIVKDMHDRKKMMYELSDAFLVLPGGMGTLDEMFEILTWSQLKLHSKPVYILNEFGFYDSLLNYIRHSQSEGFIRKEHLDLLGVFNKAEEISQIFN